MPPVESRQELIEAALAGRLASIAASADGGAKYWYTADKVLRVDDFVAENLKTDHEGAKLQVILQILAGDEFPKEGTTHTFEDCQFEIFVLAAKLWKPSSTSPYTIAPPIRRTIQNRLVRDIKVAIYGDVNLGLAEPNFVGNTEIREVNRSVFVDDTVLWVAVELRIVVTYSHKKDAP